MSNFVTNYYTLENMKQASLMIETLKWHCPKVVGVEMIKCNKSQNISSKQKNRTLNLARFFTLHKLTDWLWLRTKLVLKTRVSVRIAEFWQKSLKSNLPKMCVRLFRLGHFFHAKFGQKAFKVESF
jgi:hypothetical protein